ncbi:hypothetical protein FGO68_gene16648 [Halteria grandinella]|uniref:Uncharacterized protein n=1 Tax=Halteria grandinella TaxID=5974 RepID=A0A8J8NT83_HALGN|nr:hypothetical protein FGO68_gene16648 [Halteria grandinella]
MRKRTSNGDILKFTSKIEVNGLNPKYKSVIYYSDRKYFDSGPANFPVSHDSVITTGQRILLTFSAVNYNTFNSFSSVFYRKIPDQSEVFLDTESIIVEGYYQVNETQLLIESQVLVAGVKYTRFPLSISSALAKISGLLVVLKVSYVFMAFHRRSFLKEIEKEDTEEKRSKSSHFNFQQNHINQTTLGTSIYQGIETEIPKMRIEERYSFERIEETIFKVEELSKHNQSFQVNNTQRLLSEGSRNDSMLQKQHSQKTEKLEKTVLDLQQALQKQHEDAKRQQDQAKEQHTKQCEQIFELQQVIREMHIRLQAIEEANKNE